MRQKAVFCNAVCRQSQRPGFFGVVGYEVVRPIEPIGLMPLEHLTLTTLTPSNSL